MRFTITFFLCSILFFGCKEDSGESESDESLSNEWELEILDSIQVDYMAQIREGTFSKGVGVIKDIMSTTLVQFDSTGKILNQKTYPQEGPGSIQFLATIYPLENGYFGTSSFSGIYRLNKDLQLIGILEMPFMGEARGGAYNRKNIEVWKNNIILWYPGRDGVSPYQDFFYRDHPLLEVYDLEKKETRSMVRIPPTSKFSSDDFFGRPDVNFTVENDSLYLTLSNEPLVHVYALGDSIKWIRTLDFQPSKFVQIPGQKKPVTYQQEMQLNEASILAIYGDPNHLIVNYQSGIESEPFIENELKERRNFYRYPEFRDEYLKIYHPEKGWSNEVLIPKKVGFILNIESLNEPFYAQRDDEYIGEEQDYLTFYKLQLKRK